MAEYPKRPAFFAQKVTRLLFKTCAAQEVGQAATLLVVYIAATEDSARYRRAVTFYNSHLMAVLGFSKWEGLDRARRAAVDAGWLHYEAGGTRKPGRYWVKIPGDADGLGDKPMDETSDGLCPAKGDNEGDNQPRLSPLGGYSEGDNEGDNQGDNGGEPSYPYPNPSPTKKQQQLLASQPDGWTIETLLAEWNRIDGVKECRKVTAGRRADFAKLIKAGRLDDLPEALERVASSDFCCGRIPGKTWRANIDWLLTPERKATAKAKRRPDTVTLILEGQYDNDRGRQSTPKADAIDACEFNPDIEPLEDLK